MITKRKHRRPGHNTSETATEQYGHPFPVLAVPVRHEGTLAQLIRPITARRSVHGSNTTFVYPTTTKSSSRKKEPTRTHTPPHLED